MLIQRKKRYLFSVFLFLFLCIATVVGFYLLKSNQDTRQQASTGSCPANDPYCNGLPTPPPTTAPNSPLNDKGIVSTTYTGTRPTTKSGCGGVWMNEFCYMPGDELAGGKIIVDSGRYSYPYIEDKKVYESVNFGAESVSKVVGSTESLGKDCNGQGVAIGNTCYAYGATVNGYLVVPPRTTGCSNTAGDYCYAHLEKIEVSYDDWQAAVTAYKNSGDTKALEDLYQKTYGVSFTAGSLYDPNSANADLLKAQAILSALTNASVLQAQAAAQNAELTAKGNLTASEQALFDFNQQIIADKNLATRYQVLDQLNDSSSQQLTMDTAIKQMYSTLVVAGNDANLDKIAAEQFKAIFGYDPSEKFGNVNGILESFGIDPAQFNADRAKYSQQIAAQTQDFDKLNQEYQDYISGSSENINELKNAAIDAGVVTADQLKNLSEAEILALLLSKFSDTTPVQAQQEATAIVDARQNQVKEQQLTSQYIDHQGSAASYSDLVSLYTLYTGHAPRGQFSEAWLQEEVAKYNSQVALSMYAQTQDVTYLQNYYKNSTDAYNGSFVPTDEKALLNGIYGNQVGAELYSSIVLPARFNEAVANFPMDGGNDLAAVCKELKVTDCSINSEKATQTMALMLDKIYEGNTEVNIPDMAVSYSNQIYANTQKQETQSFWDLAFANFAMAQTADSASAIVFLGEDSAVAQNFQATMDYQSQAMDNYSTAIEASKIFNASQTFDYATDNRTSLNDYTWGMSYGNALMADNIFNREFTPEEMNLNFGQTVNLTFNQLSSQIANVDVAQNIAANYATSKHYGYTGPADTGISNIALFGADNMGVLDYNYQAAESGYYVDKTFKAWGEDIGAAMTEAGAMYAASQMNEAAANQAMFSGSEDIEFIDPIEYADQANQEFKADYHQNMMDSLYNNYVANAEKAGIDQTQQATFEQFFNDPEIQRSSQQLNYERLEKVVAPAAAIVVLPAMVASGVGVPVLLGAASSAFSLYQGAGMKAQALEIQRIDIDSRENAIIQSYIDSGASAADIEEMRTDLEIQAAALNQQGNMMLANSAVAAFTSAGGWATSLAGAANAATTANALATTGQVLTKVGQVGGIALNSYNAVNSSISSYNSFQQGNIGGGIMSGVSAFVAASGVAGNTFGLLGPTTITNKVDLALDMMNVPAGAAVDAQQVAQACYGSSGAFSEKDCTNAWIGLALSAGQNVSQISSSYKAYKGDVVAGQTADLQKQIDAIDMEIIALNGPNKGLREGLQINDLMLQRTKLADQIAGIDPNIKIANNTPTEDFLAAGIRISADLEARAQAARDAGQNDLADNLTRQAEVFRDKPIAVDAVRSQIADIDAQISKRGVLMPESEVADLQQKRAVLVNDMENLVKDLSVVDSMRQQNEALLKTTKENTAMAEYEQLMKIGKENADLVARYAPETGEVIKYTSDLEKNAANIKLEVDSNKRLLSIAALQDGLSRINDLEAQRQALARDLGADSSEIDATITRLDAEISKLNEQGVLDAEQTVKLEDLQNQKLDLQAERNKFSAIDDEIGGIRKITDVMSADNRSPWQKFTDLFSPGKKTRDAYYESLALTREAEAIKAKLAGVGADSDDAKAFREQLADVNRRLIGQQAILADARANPSKGVFRTVADFFGGIVQNREVANLKNLAKKLGTSNLDIAEKMSAKQVEINKLNDEDPVANADRIKALEADIADLRKTSQTVLRGKNALIAVDQSDKFTQYKLTDAGKKAGLNEAHLKILNDELKAFEQFRRDTGTPGFKIYSNTGSFKDQDVFLLAEIEALGAGRRGTVFGALPGMGKTDVVMPFNVLLKQRMTNASQFVVFPEAKLMKPWASDANYTPNKDFIAYVESRFGEGSVVIVKAGDQSIDPAVITRAKFVITTKDVAFDLQSTDTRLGLNLRNKWQNSYVHADEVDWTFNPNENYKLSGQQVALRDKAEFGLYLDAQKQVLGIDENGNMSAGTGLSSLRALINELSLSKSIPEGITRTSDGKGGKFADPVLEKQVLSEWLDTWGGQSKIPGLDMSADSEVIRAQINDYLTRSSDADVHQHRAEMAMINETVNFLSRVPGEDYGMTSNSRLIGDVEEIINSIAPREQGRVSGRSYSAVAESLLYNTLGARVLGVNGDVDVNRLTVGENGSEINYALLMLESKGFSLYTGTPETVAKLYKMAYGIDLKVFTDSAVDDSIARFNAPPAGTDSKIFVSLQDQIAARLGDGRNQVFVNMASGVRSNEAALNDLVRTVNETGAGYQKLFVVGANGELVEYQMTGGTLSRVDGFANTDALNARTTDLDKAGERYIKFYEYGAHVGVDTVNNVAISRAVGLCSGCDETTFSQGINRIRVKVEVKDGTSTVEYAPIDIVWMDAPAGNRNPGISDFSDSINGRQVINEALAEVSFKETLLKNSVDATFAELIDLAKNGKKGFLGFGAYEANKDVVAQLEAAQQKWKETTGMNYLLGSDDMTAQAKLEKTAAQVSAAYDELTRMLAGSGEPAKLLAKRADGAVGDNPIRLAFSGDEGYQVLGENPSYRQIVDLINQSSKHLESVNIAFTNKSSPAEVVQSEIAKVVADAESGSQVKVDDGGPDAKNPDTTGPDTAGPDRNGDAPVGGGAPVADGVTVRNADSATNKSTNNSSNTIRNIGFAAFASNFWNGTVNEDKLLNENANVVEDNKQTIIADYQAQIDGLNVQLAGASSQEETDSINNQINDLELAKADSSTIELAAKAMTTDQLAENYREGGFKNILNGKNAGDSEKGGGITLYANNFDEEAFLNDKQDEIDQVAQDLKQQSVSTKKAEANAVDAEINKLTDQLSTSNIETEKEKITSAIEALNEKLELLDLEVGLTDQKDFTAEAIAQVREKYKDDSKYQKVGTFQRFAEPIALFLIDRFNFKKAVAAFQEAYNSTEENWATKTGKGLAAWVNGLDKNSKKQTPLKQSNQTKTEVSFKFPEFKTPAWIKNTGSSISVFGGKVADYLKRRGILIYDKNTFVGKTIDETINLIAETKYLSVLPRINKVIEIGKENGFTIVDARDFYNTVKLRPNFISELNQIIASYESKNSNTRANLEAVAKGINATQSEVPTELFGGSAGHQLIGSSSIASKDKATEMYQALRKEVFALIISAEGTQLSEENPDQYLEQVTSLSSWTEYLKSHFSTTLDGDDAAAVALVKEALLKDLAWIKAQKFDQLLLASLFIDKPFYDGLLLTGDNNLANAYDNFGQSSRKGDVGAWQSWSNASTTNMEELNVENLKALHEVIFSWYDNEETNPSKKSDRAGILRDPEDPRDKEPLYAKDYQDGRPLSLTKDQIDNLDNLKSLRPGVDEPIMKFKFADGVTGPTSDGLYIGYIEFCKAENVAAELDALMAWHKEQLAKDHDPYLLAAELQQRFIAIHPFRDGNGRTSRWLMNWSLKQDGIGQSVLYDTDQDMFSSVEAWAEELRKGETRFNALKDQIIAMIDRGTPAENMIPQVEVAGTENWDYNQWTQFSTFVKTNKELRLQKLKEGSKLDRREYYLALREAVVKFELYQLTNTRSDVGFLVDPFYAASFTNTNPKVQSFVRKNYAQGKTVRRGAFNKLFLDSRFTDPHDVLSFFHGGQDDLIASNGTHRQVTKAIYELIKDAKEEEYAGIIKTYLLGLIEGIPSEENRTTAFENNFPSWIVEKGLLAKVDEMAAELAKNKGLAVPEYFAAHAASLYNFVMLDIFNSADPESKGVIESHVDGFGDWTRSPFTSYSTDDDTPESYSVEELDKKSVNAAFVFTTDLPKVGIISDRNYDGIYNFKNKYVYTGVGGENEVLFVGGQNLSLLEKIDMWMKDKKGESYKASTAERFGEDGNFLRLTVYNSKGEVISVETYVFNEDGSISKISEEIRLVEIKEEEINQSEVIDAEVIQDEEITLVDEFAIIDQLSAKRKIASALGASKEEDLTWMAGTAESLALVENWIKDRQEKLVQIANKYGLNGYKDPNIFENDTQLESFIDALYKEMEFTDGVTIARDVLSQTIKSDKIDELPKLVEKAQNDFLIEKTNALAKQFEMLGLDFPSIENELEYAKANETYQKHLEKLLALQGETGIIFVEKMDIGYGYKLTADWQGKSYDDLLKEAFSIITSRLIDKSEFKDKIFDITLPFSKSKEIWLNQGISGLEAFINEKISEKANIDKLGELIGRANDFINNFRQIVSIESLSLDEISSNLTLAYSLISSLQDSDLAGSSNLIDIKDIAATLNMWSELKSIKVSAEELEVLIRFINVAKANDFQIKDSIRTFFNAISKRPNFISELNQIIASYESKNSNTRANLEAVAKGINATQSEVPTELFGGSAGHQLIGSSSIASKDKATEMYQALRKEVFALIISAEGTQLSEENPDQYLEQVTSLSSWTEYLKSHFSTTLDGDDAAAVALVKEALLKDLAWIKAQKFDQLLLASLFIDKPFYDGLLLTGDNNLANAYDNFGQSSRKGDVGAWQSWSNASTTNMEELNVENLKALHEVIFSWYDNEETNPSKKSDRAGILRDPEDPRDKEPLYAKDYQDGRPLSLTKDQIDNLDNLKSLRPGVDEPIMKFKFADGVTGPTSDGLYIGYIEFCKAENVAAELDALMAWHKEQLAKDHDPYLLAAELQQRFIAIHPFRDGNGRTSRWLMNWSLKQDGIGQSVLYDTDQDMFSSVEAWAEELRKGETRFNALKDQIIAMIDRGTPAENMIPQVEVAGTENWDYNQWTQFSTFVKTNKELRLQKLKEGSKLDRREYYLALREAVVKFELYQLTNTRSDVGFLVDPFYAASFTNTNPKVQSFVRKNYAQGKTVRRGAFNKLFLDSRFTDPHDVLSFFHGGQDDLIASNGTHRQVTKAIYELIKDAKEEEYAGIIEKYLNELVTKSSLIANQNSELYKNYPNLITNQEIADRIKEVVEFIAANKGLKVPKGFANHATDLYNFVMLDIFNNTPTADALITGHISGGGLWDESPFTSYSTNTTSPEAYSADALQKDYVNAAFIFTSDLPRAGIISDINYDGIYNFQSKSVEVGFQHEDEVLFAGGQNLALLEKIEMFMGENSKEKYKASMVERFGEDGNFLRLTIYNKSGLVTSIEIYKFNEDGSISKIGEEAGIKALMLDTNLEAGIKDGTWKEESFSGTSSHDIRKFRNAVTGQVVLAKESPAHTMRADFMSTLFLSYSGLPSPKVEVVEIDGKKYLVSEFIDGAKIGYANNFPENFTNYKAVQKAFLLDLLTMNYDRNAENILFSNDGESITFIDNGASLGSSARGDYRDLPDYLNEEQIAQIMSLALNDKKVVNPAYAEIIDFDILKAEGRVVIKNVELIKELLEDLKKTDDAIIDQVVLQAFQGMDEEAMTAEITKRKKFVEDYLETHPNSRYAPAAIRYCNNILNYYGGNEANYMMASLKARRNSIIVYFENLLPKDSVETKQPLIKIISKEVINNKNPAEIDADKVMANSEIVTTKDNEVEQEKQAILDSQMSDLREIATALGAGELQQALWTTNDISSLVKITDWIKAKQLELGKIATYFQIKGYEKPENIVSMTSVVSLLDQVASVLKKNNLDIPGTAIFNAFDESGLKGVQALIEKKSLVKDLEYKLPNYVSSLELAGFKESIPVTLNLTNGSNKLTITTILSELESFINKIVFDLDGDFDLNILIGNTRIPAGVVFKHGNEKIQLNSAEPSAQKMISELQKVVKRNVAESGYQTRDNAIKDLELLGVSQNAFKNFISYFLPSTKNNSNKDKFFGTTCSDCSVVRAQAKNGVELADKLLVESNELSRQAENAKVAGNQKLSVDLGKQAAAKKQAALDQLDQTRFQIVNDHGMENQCVQLYLNAWVNTREAAIRQTLADTNSAIKSTYEATSFIRQTLANGFMEIKSVGLFGFATPVQNIALDDQAKTDLQEMNDNLKQWAEFKEEAGNLTEEIVAGELKTLRDNQLQNGSKEYIVDVVRVGLRDLYQSIKTNLISDNASEQLELFIDEVQPVLAALEVDGSIGSISLSELNSYLAKVVDGIEFLRSSSFDQASIFARIVAFGDTLQKRSDYMTRLQSKVEALALEYADANGQAYPIGDLSTFSAAKLIIESGKLESLIKNGGQVSPATTVPATNVPASASKTTIKVASNLKVAETVDKIKSGLNSFGKDFGKNAGRNAAAAGAAATAAGTAAYLWIKRTAAKRLAGKITMPAIKMPTIKKPDIKISKFDGLKSKLSTIKFPKFNLQAAWLRFRMNLSLRMPKFSRPRNIVAAVLSAAAIISIVYFAVVPQGSKVVPIDNKTPIVQTVEAPENQVQETQQSATDSQNSESATSQSSTENQAPAQSQSVVSEQDAAAIKKQMDQILDEAPGEWGAYIHKIGAPANEGYLYDGNKSFHAASTIKVPVAMAVMHYFESQNIPLEEALQVAPKGQDRIISQLLKAMLVESEEEATAILADFVATSTNQSINASFEEMGLDGILYGKENADGYMRSTTPEAMGLILEKLATGKSGLSKEDTDYILNLMKTPSKDDEYRIGAGLPLDIQANMAHKVGTVLEDGLFTISDVAIVTLDNGDAYVITVYSNLQNKEQYPASPGVITEISKLAYQMYSPTEVSKSNKNVSEQLAEVEKFKLPDGTTKVVSHTNIKGESISLEFSKSGKSVGDNEVSDFMNALSFMTPFYSHMQADEIRIVKVPPGKINGGKQYYALVDNEILDGNKWLGYVEFTSDYSTNGHLNKTLANLGLSSESPKAALIHELSHLIRYEKDDSGKYVKSSLLSAYDNVFYADAAGSKELPPTEYAKDYYTYKDANTEQHDRAVTEDLADTITLYLVAPEYLKQVAPLRYEFIDAIVHGTDPTLFQGAPTNADAFSFNDLCSDCAAVREATKDGVKIADNLMAEVKTLNEQAEAAKATGDQTKATDLTKQADAKQKAAIKQLSDTRNNIVNAHGMQNQCVQLYLNAWVDTREALIRKTRADVDNAIDSVFKATVLAEGMLDSKKMSVREGGILGFGATIKYKDLTADEVDQVADLLFGNVDKDIEGLQSFAVFVKNGTTVTRQIIGGSLVDLENTVVADSFGAIRIFFRNFAISTKQRFFFDELKDKVAALEILHPEDKPSISVTPSITKSPTPSITKSPTPSITPTPTLTPEQKAQEAAFWRKLWTIIGSFFGASVIGSVIYHNLPTFNNPSITPTPTQIVEQKKEEPTMSPSPTTTVSPEPTVTETQADKKVNDPFISDLFVPSTKEEKLIVLLAQAVNEWQDSGDLNNGMKLSDVLKEKLKGTEFAYLLDSPEFTSTLRRVDDIYTTFKDSNPNEEVQCVTFAILLTGAGINSDSAYNQIGIDGVKGGVIFAKQFVSAGLTESYNGVYNNGEYMEYRVNDLSVFQPGDFGIVSNKGSGNPGHIFYVVAVNKDSDGNVTSIVTADANYNYVDGKVVPDGNARISVLSPAAFETKYGVLSSKGVSSQITAIRGFENPNFNASSSVSTGAENLSVSLPTGKDVDTIAILDTALPDIYNVKNPYAEYKIKPDGTIMFTASDEWNPIDTNILPDYTTNRNADDYLKTIELFNVEQSKRYRRDSSNTYCNIYVSDVTNALGVYIPRWVNGEKLSATGMKGWLEAPLAQDLGWREVTPEEAQALANEGIPAVAVTSGHIAMVIPGEGDTFDGVYYPASAQAGSVNFDDGSNTHYGFAGAIDRGQQIQYFANASQYELVQPGSNQ